MWGDGVQNTLGDIPGDEPQASALCIVKSEMGRWTRHGLIQSTIEQLAVVVGLILR
jgi:hypothetical protein